MSFCLKTRHLNNMSLCHYGLKHVIKTICRYVILSKKTCPSVLKTYSSVFKEDVNRHHLQLYSHQLESFETRSYR